MMPLRLSQFPVPSKAPPIAATRAVKSSLSRRWFLAGIALLTVQPPPAFAAVAAGSYGAIYSDTY
jgi:hypothetical protein